MSCWGGRHRTLCQNTSCRHDPPCLGSGPSGTGWLVTGKNTDGTCGVDENKWWLILKPAQLLCTGDPPFSCLSRSRRPDSIQSSQPERREERWAWKPGVWLCLRTSQQQSLLLPGRCFLVTDPPRGKGKPEGALTHTHAHTQTHPSTNRGSQRAEGTSHLKASSVLLDGVSVRGAPTLPAPETGLNPPAPAHWVLWVLSPSSPFPSRLLHIIKLNGIKSAPFFTERSGRI